jgi:glutamate-ammonia-ligase adenylyltransferase
MPADNARAVLALLDSLPDRRQSAAFFQRLKCDEFRTDRTAIRYALTIFSYSRFLSEAVLRHPGWLLEIAAARDLHRSLHADEYAAQLSAASLSALNIARFRRRQLLRIVLRDALGIADIAETVADLSSLADAILNVALTEVRNGAAHEFGDPGAQFSVIALGKLGGQELNYSSDIDLMFVCSGGASCGGLSVKEFFKLVVNRLTSLLSTHTSEGMAYRVDLRLRPDGSAGEICPTLQGAKNYYASRGRDWELQMLIKARVAAGDLAPGHELLQFAEPLIYRTTVDFRAIEAVSETRARIHEKQLRRRANGAVDVKLARGGIRDVEFLVQCLQRLYGGREQWVRHGGTLLALSRLRDKNLLSPQEYSRLAEAWRFLRHLEHRLQFDEDRQTHTLPANKDDLDILARRMPGKLSGAGALQNLLDQHLAGVRDLYDRVIPSRAMEGQPAASIGGAQFPTVNLSRLLKQRAPHLLREVSLMPPAESFESFLEKIVLLPDWLSRMETNRELARCTIDLFEHSAYFAGQLVRHPELLAEVEYACNARQGREGFSAPLDPAGLRRYFREQMVRIQADSVYHAAPVFKTLRRTSDLAQIVIEAAYRNALGNATPPDQMMIVALGRLGVREFDLASDADLNFIVPDAAAGDLPFWVRIAEQIIATIGAYRGDGVVFNIDTRLRPYGREGALVQTESACRDYFAGKAEAWEGISWMKARAVAGDVDRATALLAELQQIDWQRHGQTSRSRSELARMRARLEREQGVREPLKAGPGGYYDIDFALMYLRLRDGERFYKLLNTPERIAVLVESGSLTEGDATFLHGAATFFRAVDHGMRIATGHADGRLPSNPEQMAILTQLVHRWTSDEMHGEALDALAQRLRRDTRGFFERTFAA